MKIRIKGNSIRYRLSRSEVEHFAIEGIIREETHFNFRTLAYVLQRTNSSVISAGFNGDTITVYMPAELSAGWDTNEEMGFEGQSGVLTILIEKDLQCIDNTTEDQSDNYPNPLTVHNHGQC